MDKGQIFAIFALTIAVLSIFAAILYQPVLASDNSEIYTMYFGLTDSEGNPIDMNTTRSTIDDLCELHGLGFTSYVAFGGYVSNGTLISNDSLVYVFALTDEETVRLVGNEARTALDFDSIMFQKSVGTVSFL